MHALFNSCFQSEYLLSCQVLQFPPRHDMQVSLEYQGFDIMKGGNGNSLRRIFPLRSMIDNR